MLAKKTENHCVLPLHRHLKRLSVHSLGFEAMFWFALTALCHTVTAWLGLEKQCSLGLHHLLLLQLPLQMYLHGLSYLRYLCS